MEDGEEADSVADDLVEVDVLVEGNDLPERGAASEGDECATYGEEDEGDVDVEAERGAFGADEGLAEESAGCGSCEMCAVVRIMRTYLLRSRR